MRDENISCNLHSSLTDDLVERGIGKNSSQWRKSRYCSAFCRYMMRVEDRGSDVEA